MKTSPLPMPHLLWHGPTVYNGHVPGASDTHTCCRAFHSGVVTTYYYDLGLSRPDIKPLSPVWEANTLPLSQRRGRGSPSMVSTSYIDVNRWLSVVRFEHVKQRAIGSCYDPLHFGNILINVRYESCTVIMHVFL